MKLTMRLNLQLIALTMYLSLNMNLTMVYGQAYTFASTLESTPSPFAAFLGSYSQKSSSQSQLNELKSPLLRSIAAKFYPNDENSLPTQQQTTQRPQFFKSLLQRLDERRSQSNVTAPIQNELRLTINDGSSNVVNIEFIPNVFSAEQQETWSSIVELLADSLAYVIEEAERKGYIANFKYGISLENIPPYVAFGPGLSDNALKSAAG